jgi:hypothetical protein
MNVVYDEFVCRECGNEIKSFPPHDPPPTICATCRWLDEFVSDPVEREKIRARTMGER